MDAIADNSSFPKCELLQEFCAKSCRYSEASVMNGYNPMFHGRRRPEMTRRVYEYVGPRYTTSPAPIYYHRTRSYDYPEQSLCEDISFRGKDRYVEGTYGVQYSYVGRCNNCDNDQVSCRKVIMAPPVPFRRDVIARPCNEVFEPEYVPSRNLARGWDHSPERFEHFPERLDHCAERCERRSYTSNYSEGVNISSLHEGETSRQVSKFVSRESSPLYTRRKKKSRAKKWNLTDGNEYNKQFYPNSTFTETNNRYEGRHATDELVTKMEVVSQDELGSKQDLLKYWPHQEIVDFLETIDNHWDMEKERKRIEERRKRAQQSLWNWSMKLPFVDKRNFMKLSKEEESTLLPLKIPGVDLRGLRSIAFGKNYEKRELNRKIRRRNTALKALDTWAQHLALWIKNGKRGVAPPPTLTNKEKIKELVKHGDESGEIQMKDHAIAEVDLDNSCEMECDNSDYELVAVDSDDYDSGDYDDEYECENDVLVVQLPRKYK